MNLALFPPLGGSFTALQETGQLARFASSYLPRYAETFTRLVYGSYRDERLADFPSLHSTPQLTLLPNARRQNAHLYAWRMAGQHAAALATCQVSRVFQATGIVPAWQAKRRWRIPIVATYGYHYADLARRSGHTSRAVYYTLLEQLTLRRADAVIVTTAPIARYVQRFMPTDRVHLIPNGVNLRQFYPAAQLPEGPPTVAFLGRLSPEKNPQSLLAAAHRLQAATPLRLAFIGDGPLRDTLAQEAQRLGVDAHFYGTVSHDQLPELLRAANAFVLPSYSEGHPKALLEAMACGLPVVASDIPGNRSVVEPGANGLVFPPGDSAALAAQLAVALGDREQAHRLGRAAHAAIVQHYDLDNLVGREVALLVELAQAQRGSAAR
ncbi:MAG: glycosyltransferase [Caldilineaceae bacterium]|nr:glycosyltransferase [Caldilineaceae bacterium]